MGLWSRGLAPGQPPQASKALARQGLCGSASAPLCSEDAGAARGCGAVSTPSTGTPLSRSPVSQAVRRAMLALAGRKQGVKSQRKLHNSWLRCQDLAGSQLLGAWGGWLLREPAGASSCCPRAALAQLWGQQGSGSESPKSSRVCAGGQGCLLLYKRRFGHVLLGQVSAKSAGSGAQGSAALHHGIFCRAALAPALSAAVGPRDLGQGRGGTKLCGHISACLGMPHGVLESLGLCWEAQHKVWLGSTHHLPRSQRPAPFPGPASR